MFVKTYTFFHGMAPFYEYKHFSNTFCKRRDGAGGWRRLWRWRLGFSAWGRGGGAGRGRGEAAARERKER